MSYRRKPKVVLLSSTPALGFGVAGTVVVAQNLLNQSLGIADALDFIQA